MITKLMHCVRCHQLNPVFGGFGDFGRTSDLPGVEWASTDLDAQEEFDRVHREHQVEELTIDAETSVSDKPSYEPLKVSYFEATNGRERFLVRRTKERLDAPAFYEIVPGLVQGVRTSSQRPEDLPGRDRGL